MFLLLSPVAETNFSEVAMHISSLFERVIRMNKWSVFPSLRRALFSRRVMIQLGTLALLVGMLAAGVLLVHRASAIHAQSTASRQQNTARISLLAQSGITSRLETFTENQGVIMHRWSDDNGASWSAWVSLPAAVRPFVGTPAVVSDGIARLNVFARDTWGVIWIDTYNNGPWSGWTVLPAITAIPQGVGVFGNVTNSGDLWAVNSDPAVTSWGPGRLEVFVNAIDSNTGAIGLLHTWADNYTWADKWEVLGTGYLQGTPAAISWGSGRDDVFVWDADNELVHKWFDNGSWSSGWQDLGGALTSSPSVASWGVGHLDVFARNSSGDLAHTWFLNNQWNSGWQDLGCCLAGDVTNPVAAVSQGYPTVDVFVIGTLHDLYHKGWNGSAWSDWQFLDHSLNFVNIAAAVWVPVAPPPPPTPTFSPKCGRPGQPPCHITP
jgi:hypothetical protein